MTRAERRRLEKAGARKEPVYTLTQTQINEIKLVIIHWGIIMKVCSKR